MTEAQCPHGILKRKNSGDWHWYECPVCGQKFKVPRNPGVIEPWDGKVRVRRRWDEIPGLSPAENGWMDDLAHGLVTPEALAWVVRLAGASHTLK